MPLYFWTFGRGPLGMDDNRFEAGYTRPADYHLQWQQRHNAEVAAAGDGASPSPAPAPSSTAPAPATSLPGHSWALPQSAAQLSGGLPADNFPSPLAGGLSGPGSPGASEQMLGGLSPFNFPSPLAGGLSGLGSPGSSGQVSRQPPSSANPFLAGQTVNPNGLTTFISPLEGFTTQLPDMAAIASGGLSPGMDFSSLPAGDLSGLGSPDPTGHTPSPGEQLFPSAPPSSGQPFNNNSTMPGTANFISPLDGFNPLLLGDTEMASMGLSPLMGLSQLAGGPSGSGSPGPSGGLSPFMNISLPQATSRSGTRSAGQSGQPPSQDQQPLSSLNTLNWQPVNPHNNPMPNLNRAPTTPVAPSTFLPATTVESRLDNDAVLQLISLGLNGLLNPGEVVLPRGFMGLQYLNFWSVALALFANGTYAFQTMGDVRRELRNQLEQGLSVGDSPVCRAILADFQSLRADQAIQYVDSRQVLLPFNNANMDLVRDLNPGLAPIRNTTRAPTQRRLSPGPPGTVFPSGSDRPPNGIVPHPNPLSISLLVNIPLNRQILNGIVDPTISFRCQSIKRNENGVETCGAPTGSFCESVDHVGQGHPICVDCNNTNKAKFFEQFKELYASMRCWGCASCSAKSLDVSTWNGLGVRIWVGDVLDLGARQSLNPTHNTITDQRGGYFGPPLPVTGCSCALKLFDRFICAPHRLEAFVQLQEQVFKTKQYINAVFGDDRSCAFCTQQPAVDKNHFTDVQGRAAVFQCSACLGVVIVGPESHNRPVLGSEAWGLLSAPLAGSADINHMDYFPS
ncbi:hypothetical protein F5Y15DRAFT_415922 [Xylariaceae sp. FL0016]|nr:hypothetical protein F5Y15DRAFT_415922 [Xylariaceae sp. FL0016]